MNEVALTFEDQRRDALMASVDEIRYTEATVSSDGALCYTPNHYFVPRVQPHHPFYHEHQEQFLLERYQYARPPIDLGHSRLDHTLASMPNVLRMPIQFPSTPMKVPVELKPLWDLICRIAEYEAGFNSSIEACFVHVTFDRAIIEPGTTHRYPGWHGDGVQGAKFAEKTLVEHSYIVSTAPPTQFCIQPFFFNHLNDARHSLFHEMEVQAREQNVYTTIPWHLYLIDPYMVHRTPGIAHKQERIFLRVTYAYTELMNPHNTPNPCFAGQQYAERHDVRKFLSLYPSEVPWPMYGLSSGPGTDREVWQ